MQVKVSLNNFRMSAKKARRVADLVRGKNTDEAQGQLSAIQSKMREPLDKLINSGVATAAHNFGLDKNNLYIESIKVDEGKVMKRWRPRAHGRAYPILKKSCHVELILNEVEEGKGRVKVEKKEAKTLTYKELKKMTDEADKLIEKQQSKKGKKKEAGGETKSKQEGQGGSGALGRIFRRKSI